MTTSRGDPKRNRSDLRRQITRLQQHTAPGEYNAIHGEGAFLRDLRAAWARIEEPETDPDSFDPENPCAGFVTIADYRAGVPTNIPWIVPGLVYGGGVTLISGPPKAGKSTLMSNVIACRERGGQFLGLTIPLGPTLLVTEEGGIPVLHKTTGLNDLIVYDRKASQGETFDATLGKIERWGTDNPGGLVFIDTFAIWAGLEDENAAGQATVQLGKIAMVAQRTGLAIVVVHHTRKGGGKDGEAIRGSGAMLATVDISIELKRTEDQNNPDERFLDFMGRVIPPDRWLLGFDRATLGYTRLVDDIHKLEGIEADLANIPATGEGLKALETGLKPRRIEALLNVGRLRRERSTGRGGPWLYWSIPAACPTTTRPRGYAYD